MQRLQDSWAKYLHIGILVSQFLAGQNVIDRLFFSCQGGRERKDGPNLRGRLPSSEGQSYTQCPHLFSGDVLIQDALAPHSIPISKGIQFVLEEGFHKCLQW